VLVIRTNSVLVIRTASVLVIRTASVLVIRTTSVLVIRTARPLQKNMISISTSDDFSFPTAKRMFYPKVSRGTEDKTVAA
jgi:hypothetical protein